MMFCFILILVIFCKHVLIIILRNCDTFDFSDGSAPSYATETRMEERINPADEAKIKMPRKREAEATKQMPDGAKGPKFTKKQMEKEVNKRSAAQFGNLTDY